MEEDLHPATDQELEIRAASGDKDAFGELYERYCGRVYDFLLRMVRDPDEAADIMQETFMRAMRSLSGERAGAAAFSTWLFTIARNLALTRLERGKRTVPLVEDEEEGGGEQWVYQLVDPDRFVDPQEATQAKETANLVWEAAAALQPKEYSLLDLHVRQGLDSAEISEVLGVSKGNARTMLSRLKDAFEDAFTSLVMLRQGRRKCEALDRLIREHRFESVSVPARKLIMRHTSECTTCQEQRRRLVSAETVLRSLVPLPLPLFLKHRIAEAAFGQGVSVAYEGAKSGILKSLWHHSGGRFSGVSFGVKATGALVMAVAVIASIASWVIAQGGTGDNHALVTAATPTLVHEWAAIAITPTPTPTATFIPTSTPPPPSASPPTSMPTVAPPPPPPPPASCVGVPPFPQVQIPTGYACSEITGAPSGETQGFNGPLEQSVVELENYYRSTLGLAALIRDSRLDEAARGVARQLVEVGWIGTNFLPDHISPDGRDLLQRLADVGLVRGQNLYWASENYYWGINGANACRIFSGLSEFHCRDIAADCLYGAPSGPYYGIGCYFTYSPQLQFVCIVDYAAFM